MRGVMPWQPLSLVLLLLASLAACQGAAVSVEHAFGAGDFAPAGTLHGSLADAVKQAPRRAGLTLERQPVTREEQAALAKLVSEDGFYRLRLPADPSQLGGPTVAAAVRARCLAAAGMAARLQLHIGPGGTVSAVEFSLPPGGCQAADGAHAPPAPRGGWAFPDTEPVAVRLPVAAPALDLRPFGGLGMDGPGQAAGGALNPSGTGGAGGQGEKDGKGGQKPPEEKSWLQRNWMFVVPAIFLLMNVMGNAAQDAGGRAGAAQRRPAGSAAMQRR